MRRYLESSEASTTGAAKVMKGEVVDSLFFHSRLTTRNAASQQFRIQRFRTARLIWKHKAGAFSHCLQLSELLDGKLRQRHDMALAGLCVLVGDTPCASF